MYSVRSFLTVVDSVFASLSCVFFKFSNLLHYLKCALSLFFFKNKSWIYIYIEYGVFFNQKALEDKEVLNKVYNAAADRGGALYDEDGLTGLVQSSSFAHNVAASGGAVGSLYSSVSNSRRGIFLQD